MKLFWPTIGAAVFQAVFFGILLFLPAWTLNWPRAWLFLTAASMAMSITMQLVFVSRPELLHERTKPFIQEGQPTEDKIALMAFLVSYVATIILIPLDVFRFHLLPTPSMAISWAGLLLAGIGWLIISLTFKENEFGAPVVKLQAERNQHVIDTGVYAIVRHPMYSGFILLSLGMALWLESYTATLATLIPILILGIRAIYEERFLAKELAGYTDYQARVKFRFIPYIW